MGSNKSEIKIKWEETYIFLPDKTIGCTISGKLYDPIGKIVIGAKIYSQWDIEDIFIYNEGKGGIMRNIYLLNFK